MRNPLRSEAEAYRFLGVVIVGAVLIIVAAVINKWLGVAVAVLVFVGLFRWLRKEPVPGSADHAPLLASSTPPGTPACRTSPSIRSSARSCSRSHRR